MPVVARAAQALGGQALAVLEQLFALAADASGALLVFRRHADARQRLGVPGDIPVQARDQGQRVAPVGLHFFAVFVPVARPHHEALDAQAHQTSVQHKAKRTGLVATMHDVGLLRLLGDPRDERLGRETLRGLRRGAVNLAHNDVFTPMHVDAELDHSVRFAARHCAGGDCGRGCHGRSRGCGRRSGLGIMGNHSGGQLAPRRSPDHPMLTSTRPRFTRGFDSTRSLQFWLFSCRTPLMPV